jgi:cell division GTPase FtsZ
VHREDLVVQQLVAQDLEAGLGQLGPDGQGEQAADEEEQERVDEVQDPDLLVIGRGQPFVLAAQLGGGGGRQRRGRHRSSLTGP